MATIFTTSWAFMPEHLLHPWLRKGWAEKEIERILNTDDNVEDRQRRRLVVGYVKEPRLLYCLQTCTCTTAS